MTTWQPISSAPKDGTDVLVYTIRLHVRVAYYDKHFATWQSRPGRYAISVTHWMPLPEPPAA